MNFHHATEVALLMEQHAWLDGFQSRDNRDGTHTLLCSIEIASGRALILRGLPYASTKEQRDAIEAQGLEKFEEEKWGTALADLTTAVSEVDAQYYRSLAKHPDQIRISCGNRWAVKWVPR
jgi:hypothetical protein